MTATLYYVRHGETEWSLSGQHTGVTDIPLTENGRARARLLAPWLSQVTFTQVLTSPRIRARHTCELAGLGTAAVIEPDLAEWDYGEYEGIRSADIVKTRPGWNIFRDGCPGGESPDAIASRADRLIARLDALGGTIALFAHGQFGMVLAARWIGLPVSAAQHFALGPASLSTLGYPPGHADRRAITLWNADPVFFGV